MNALKFLLQHGVFIIASMTQEEQRDILEKWSSGWYKLKDQQIIRGTCRLSNSAWAVDVSSIMAIHTAVFQAETAPPQPNFPLQNNSGIPFR